MSSQLSSSRHDSRMPFVPRRIFAAPGCQGNKQMEQPLLRKRASLDVVGALLQSFGGTVHHDNGDDEHHQSNAC